MKNIIFIAPPAAGKGTISDYLVKNYHFLHISTGDLLREEIASGSKFGREIDEIIKRGSLVKDDIVKYNIKGGNMEIQVGKTSGFCYGVKNAVDKTNDILKQINDYLDKEKKDLM